MFIKPETNSVVLHDARRGQWLYFNNPEQIYSVHELAAVLDTLREIEQRGRQRQLYAAGFISYEAAAAFDPVLTTHPPDDFPLLWFGLYREPATVALPAPAPLQGAEPAWQAEVTGPAYNAAIQRIKHYIREGDTYQVNYSYRLRSKDRFDPWAFFTRMVRSQGSGFSAYVDSGDWAVCSASPELFFQLHGNTLESRPMKGTRERAPDCGRDQANREWLTASEKDRAENLMILDMVRNDMGRIAGTGSVRTHDIFSIEKYPTVWQMTSSVTAETDAAITDIFQALFPAASITGAPKARTMQIITELEGSPRRLYTGTVGYFGPGREAQFNVAIRSVVVDRRDGSAEYGTGGGIVWDSSNSAEFEEAQIKARVLTHQTPEFSLLETLLWTADAGYFLLEAHLQRLAASADYFSRPIDIEAIRAQLLAFAGELRDTPHRVRLLLAAHGEPQLSAVRVSPSRGDYRLTLARDPVNAATDVFLYHKTSHREQYQQALAAAPGFDDVLLWNRNGEITESCIANVVVEMDGKKYTPPVSCGLLAGVYRGHLLAQGEIQEKVITVEDASRAERLFLINSVRGMWRARLVQQAAHGERAGTSITNLDD